jgi:hypothetical protein
MTLEATRCNQERLGRFPVAAMAIPGQLPLVAEALPHVPIVTESLKSKVWCQAC